VSRFAIRLAAVCGLLLLLQTGLFGAAMLITTRSFGRLQEQQAQDDAARAAGTLRGQIAKLASTAGDWGNWDDSYRFMLGEEPNFAADNLQPDALSTLKVDVVAFVRPDGTVFSSRAIDESGTAVPLPNALSATLEARPSRLQLNRLGDAAQGVMILPDGPLLFSARPVTTSASDRPPVGYVMFGRFLRGQAIGELSSAVRLDVRVGVLPAAIGFPPDAVSSIRSGATTVAAPLSGSLMGGYSVVDDYRGQPALVLGVAEPRTITEAGAAATRSFGLALAIFGTLSIGIVMYVMYRDERSRRRLGEEIRAREAFFAAASHDLRTPLNSIIGFTGVVLSGAAGKLSQEQRRQLGMSYRSSKQLLELINDILRVQAADVGLAPELSEFDVCATVGHIVTQSRAQAEGKGLVLEFEGEPACIVSSDEQLVRRIVTNLVSNAVKYTESGSIVVAVRSADDEVSIAVRDTGRGVPSDAVPQLFDAFYQVPGANGAGQAEGTGLGLAIAQRLARAIGGRIGVETSLGQGSTFTLWIPARRDLGDGS
jgi:signal transduction histidine kinase